jgi:hypothetical protein
MFVAANEDNMCAALFLYACYVNGMNGPGI